jgi:hypothetical protein
MGIGVNYDVDRAGDSESRIRLTGIIIDLLGVPIFWRSKAQEGVTVSSSEAEYLAMSVLKEYIFYLLTRMLIKVKIPIICKEF